MLADRTCLSCEKLFQCPWMMRFLFEALPPNLHILGKPYYSNEGIIVKRKEEDSNEMVVREGNHFTKVAMIDSYFAKTIPIAFIRRLKERNLPRL